MLKNRTQVAAIIAASLFAGLCQSQAPVNAAPDAKAAGDEAVRLLSQYLQIDTTNPPGNEILAANFF